MNLADKIREMSLLVEEEKIAESLSIPFELVKGVLSGDISDEDLKDYDPLRNKKTLVVEKKVFTRGKVLMTVGHGPLAGIMAMCLAQKNAVAVVDLETYPTLPFYIGMRASDLPQYVNFLWDDSFDKKQYKENLFVYLMPPKEDNPNGLNEVFKAFQTVIINCPENNWMEYASIADIIYIPQVQNLAGIHKLFQMTTNNKYEEKIQGVWIDNELKSKPQYLNVLREFSNILITGTIPEMYIDINPNKYLQPVKKILQPVFPELKSGPKKLFGLLG